MGRPLLLHELLPKLMEERGLKPADVARRATLKGWRLPEGTITGYYNRRSNFGRMPQAWVLEALADGLGEDPDIFYEWPIAKAAAEARPAVTQRAREAAQRLDDTPPTSRRKRRAQGDGGKDE